MRGKREKDLHSPSRMDEGKGPVNQTSALPGSSRARTFSVSDPLNLLRPRRRIEGISAVLLPFNASGTVDWTAFSSLIRRTREAGLTPAVNMDTGFANLIDDGHAAARSTTDPRRTRRRFVRRRRVCFRSAERGFRSRRLRA